MDMNDSSPMDTSGEQPAMDTVDWRTQLQPFRQQMVNRMLDSFKKFIPYGYREELLLAAKGLEEKAYNEASTQWDYLWKVSHNMHKIDIRNSMPNQVDNSSRPLDQGYLGMQPHVHNQARSIGMPLPLNQCQTRRHLLPQIIQNRVGVQNSSSLSSGMPNVIKLVEDDKIPGLSKMNQETIIKLQQG